MRVSLFAQVTLKDRPNEFRGRTGESFSVGKDEPVSLSAMILSTLGRLADYYSIFMTAEELNTELDAIVTSCQSARFEEVKEKT